MKLSIKLEKYENERKGLVGQDFSSLEKHHHFYENAAIGCFTASMSKANAGVLKTFCEGILGGIFISIGYIVAMVAMNGSDNPGLRQIIFGVTFPIGMLLVTFLGGGLYTSHCLGLLNAATRNVSYGQYFKNLMLMFVANFLGCFLAASIMVLTGLMFKLDGSTTAVASGYGGESMKMVIHKLGAVGDLMEKGNTISGSTMGMTFLNCLASGIFCNVLVGGSLYLTYSSKNPAASVLLIFLAIFAFCVAGFQHVVANSFMFWIDIFSLHHQMAGDPNHLLPGISVGYFVAFNLIPAFFGNYIGGAILIPMLVYFANKNTIKTLNKKLRLEWLEDQIEMIKATLSE